MYKSTIRKQIESIADRGSAKYDNTHMSFTKYDLDVSLDDSLGVSICAHEDSDLGITIREYFLQLFHHRDTSDQEALALEILQEFRIHSAEFMAESVMRYHPVSKELIDEVKIDPFSYVNYQDERWSTVFSHCTYVRAYANLLIK